MTLNIDIYYTEFRQVQIHHTEFRQVQIHHSLKLFLHAKLVNLLNNWEDNNHTSISNVLYFLEFVYFVSSTENFKRNLELQL